MNKFLRSALIALIAFSLNATAAPVFSTTLKNAQLNQITSTIGNAGLLVIGTSALSGATGVLCTVTLGSPVAPSASSGVLTFTMPQNCTATGTGTAAKAELRTSGGTVVVNGLTVGLSATDVIVDNTSFVTDQVYTQSTLTVSQ